MNNRFKYVKGYYEGQMVSKSIKLFASCEEELEEQIKFAKAFGYGSPRRRLSKNSKLSATMHIKSVVPLEHALCYTLLTIEEKYAPKEQQKYLSNLLALIAA